MYEAYYRISDKDYWEITTRIQNALSVKVKYNIDKLAMAEDTIRQMELEIRMLKNSVAKIKGDCSPN